MTANPVSPDWLYTRVVVVSMAIVGPIYFFLLVQFLPIPMTPFGDPLYDSIFRQLVVPLVFSAPWVGGIYYTRFRLANTIQLMQETTTTVPLRWRIFYGGNAVFVMAFFILPLAIAPVAILGGLFVAGHVFYTIGVGKMGGGKAASFLGILVAIALCILPTFVMIQFVPSYLLLWDGILQAWQVTWFSVVYGVAQCLVNALSFGAPVYFMYFAAEQYDKGVYGVSYTKTPTIWIRVGELMLFLVFVYLYLPPIQLPGGIVLQFANLSEIFTSLINYVSLGIVIIMILVRKALGVSDNSTLGGPINILIVGMFLVVELFFKTNLLIVSLVIWLAFILFSSVFVANYLRASPREMY